MSIKFAFIGCLCSAFFALPAAALDLFSDALPQSTDVSCQSFAAVLALASQNDPAFQINTFSELRQIETEFRMLAEANGGPLTHASWPKAMSDLTGGKYTFEHDRNSSDIVEWLTRIKNATTIKSDVDILIGKLKGTSFEVVLTSVLSIDGSPYADGHIIAVMGVIGSGIDSTTRLVAFNSAIKGSSGTGVMCNGDFMATQGDLKYKAGVLNTNNFELKKFPRFLFMRLVRK